MLGAEMNIFNKQGKRTKKLVNGNVYEKIRNQKRGGLFYLRCIS